MALHTTERPSISWRRELHGLFALREGPWRWAVGMQAGLAIGLILAVFTLAGRQSQGLIASMGAFTALYMATARRVDRMRALPFIGAGFVAASAIGVLGSFGTRWTVAALISVAALACAVTIRTGIGPPGPMMFTLVAGVSAHLATPASRGGPSLDRLALPLYVAIGAIGSILVVVAPLALPAIRRREGAPSGLRRLVPANQFDLVNTVIFARVVAAVTIATILTIPWNVRHAYWVVMVAGVLLQVTHSIRPTLIRTTQRVLGTCFGVGAFALVLLIKPTGIWLALLLGCLQFATEVVVTRNYGLAMVFITPISLTIAAGGVWRDVWTVTSDRVLDTLAGAAIAVTVLLVSEWLLARRKLQV